ncbi:MAG: RIP metalloprotease RseP [Candidatus Levybacteria bacterium CG10_big_fil_rev_8_21_14_0_10_35_13]|nr:MAG: RIP metalloprotease RseP [Candidatus Levybacteria bacterium CG10_big_fil_rev_8_21_14_0_10_35_13]
MLITILVFLIILSVLVLVHELGHFVTAKLFKIKVEEFGFGLPPRAFGIKYGETLYSINWLPIGGFVKLYGEDAAGGGRVRATINNQQLTINKREERRAFYSRPIWQRATVIAAGVFMNFVLAVAIISFLFSFVGVPTPGDRVVIGEVVKGSPAQTSGLKAGDIVESINGVKITGPDQLVAITKKNIGESLKLKVQDSNLKVKEITVAPRKTYPKGEGPMGIAISQEIITKKYPLYEAPFVGTKEALRQSWMIVSGLGSLVTQLATKGSVPQDVAGPVGIAQLTGQVVSIGPVAILSFVSLLSLNLAIINILPIPALDGGRLFFIIIEAVTRRKVSPHIETAAHTIGMAVLLLLIALITLHDLIRVVSGVPIIPQIK